MRYGMLHCYRASGFNLYQTRFPDRQNKIKKRFSHTNPVLLRFDPGQDKSIPYNLNGQRSWTFTKILAYTANSHGSSAITSKECLFIFVVCLIHLLRDYILLQWPQAFGLKTEISYSFLQWSLVLPHGDLVSATFLLPKKKKKEKLIQSFHIQFILIICIYFTKHPNQPRIVHKSFKQTH